MIQIELGLQAIIIGVAGLIVGSALTFLILKKVANSKIKSAQLQADAILKQAEKEIEIQQREHEFKMKNMALKLRKDFEKKFSQETREKKEKFNRIEKRLRLQEAKIEAKLDSIEKQQEDLRNKQAEIEKKAQELDMIKAEQRQRLEQISHLSAQQAKDLLMKQLEEELQYEIALKMKNIEEQAKETAEKKSQEIIALAIQRCAMDQVIDSMVTVVNLPNDEMKGRIIGREGRNIRTLEHLTGVNVIIDDTPEAVVLSGFNTIKREIARLALEKLISDGRIHPAKIEELVEKAQIEIHKKIKELGEQVTLDLGIRGLEPEIIEKLGKLHYRTSYGQNVLQHSKEVAYLAGMMAAELGANIELAKRAGLLHDIGKAFDHEVEGSHAAIGAKFVKKFNESDKLVNAIAAHHEEVRPLSIEAVLIQVADSISAARSGARRESVEAYVKRLEDLENIASSFKGVDTAYALQAGREIRIIVNTDKVDDVLAVKLSKDIAKKIESELEYPGQIKVTIIRELRAVEYAK